MDKPDFELVALIQYGAITTFAAIGGGLAYVLRRLNMDKKPELLRGFVEMLASGFVGLIAMLMCDALGLDWKWSGVVVGMFGWMGAEASIMVISQIVKSRLGIKNDIDKNP